MIGMRRRLMSTSLRLDWPESSWEGKEGKEGGEERGGETRPFFEFGLYLCLSMFPL